MPNTIFEQYLSIKEQLENMSKDLDKSQANFTQIERDFVGSVDTQQYAFYMDKKIQLQNTTQKLQELTEQLQNIKQQILNFFKENSRINEVIVQHKEANTIPTGIQPNEDFTDLNTYGRM